MLKSIGSLAKNAQQERRQLSANVDLPVGHSSVVQTMGAWIAANIETAPADELRRALECALINREHTVCGLLGRLKTLANRLAL